MFPSNGLNPFPQYYFASSSTPIDNQQVDSDDINFLHPESSTLSSPFYFHNNQIPQTNLINLGSTVSNTMTNYDHYQSYLGKKPARKDQHSKIHTAHGLRDRRVRLSIEIAREFFDLQDKLGFDKASKTVEWLLNKSEKDIMELANTKLSVNNINRAAAKSLNFSSTNSECGGVLEMNTDDHNDEDPEVQVLASKSKSLMGVSKLDENIIMKDSRSAKARARARERTREKTMNTKRTWNCQQYSSSSKNY